MLGLGLSSNRSNAIKKMPLDSYKDNLVLGFSYYKLLSSYKGNCVRVRRSSDNSEQDFGFVNNYIDYTGILSFCNGGSGYVTTWYNQYANGNNAVQTSSGNQPSVVVSGVFQANGLNFVSTNSNYFKISDYSAVQITTPQLAIYCNAYHNSTVTGWYLSKNINSFATCQYGIYIEASTIALALEGAGRLAPLISGTKNYKTLYNWTSKDTNGLQCNVNNTTAAVTFSTDLTNRSNISLGARSNSVDMSTLSYFVDASIKTIIISNQAIDYSIVSKV